MKKLGSLAILGLLLVAGWMPAQAGTPPSDWPSINYDGAQSNYNAVEKQLSSKNILKLKVRWTAPIASQSYPIVAGGRAYVPIVAGRKIHVRVHDAVTGKPITTFPKDALGGMLLESTTLYLAGHIVQGLDPATGNKLVEFNPSPKATGGVFIYPVSDRKVIAVGYYAGPGSKVPNSLYGLDPQSNQILWKAPTSSAQGALGTGKIVTQTSAGSQFYDESTGHPVSTQKSIYSDWFWGSSLAYTVATVKRTGVAIYAYSGGSHRVWKRTVGPYMIANGWPHALTSDRLFVETLKPQAGVVALDPTTGKQLWFVAIPDIQRIVVANDLLLVLTYGLGQPTRIVAFESKTGKSLGAVVLSSGYNAFGAPNGLMVADGMVFIRAVGPGNVSMLVALGPGSGQP